MKSEVLGRRLSWLLAAVLFFGELGLTPERSDLRFWYESTWITLFTLFLFVILYLSTTRRLAHLARRAAPWRSPMALSVWLWISVVTVSFFCSTQVDVENPLVRMRLAEYIVYILFFVVLQDFFSRYRPEFRVIFSGVIAAALVLTLAYFLGRITETEPSGAWGLPMLHFGALSFNDNIRRLGYLLESALVLLLYWSMVPLRNRIFPIVVAAALFLFLLWLEGRASLLGLYAVGVLYLFIEGKKRGWTKRSMILATALAIAVPVGSYLLGFGHTGSVIDRTLSAPSLDSASSSRLELWSAMLREWWSRSPWIGTGPQSLLAYPGMGSGIIHPHNFLLQFLIEWGVVGTVLFLWLLGSLLYRGWRSFRRGGESRPARLTAGLAIVALSVTGLLGGIYFFSQTVLILLIMYAAWSFSEVSD